MKDNIKMDLKNKEDVRMCTGSNFLRNGSSAGGGGDL
jgi:hypothetical protein